MRCPSDGCKTNLTREAWFLRPFGTYSNGCKLVKHHCKRCGYERRDVQLRLTGLDDCYSDASKIHPDDWHRWDGYLALHRESMDDDRAYLSVMASIPERGNNVGMVGVW